MIHIFRKEMKKWHSVLWVVFAALALSSIWAIFFRRPHPSEIPVAKVNNSRIIFKEYQRVLNELRMQIETYKTYARAYGISVDLFLSLAGLDYPEGAALDKCIRNVLLDVEKDKYNINLDSDIFLKQLSDFLPAQLKDSVGNIDIKAYQFYLSRLYMSVPEFEKSQEDMFEREFFQDFVKSSYYVTTDDAKQLFIDNNASKKFAIIKFPFELFLDKEKKKTVNEDNLKEFFNLNKEKYRVAEKRKAKYWVLNPQEYAKTIEVNDDTIQTFYEKNKSSIFRIPPKVKVRHIFFRLTDNMLPEEIEKILNNAKNIKSMVEKGEAKFEDLAKKYSQDSKTASNGGLIDFFDKGTYDPEFEKVALRLTKNGQLSDIVKTKDGFELIQLVERTAASAKPLSSVREEIIKTIKAKKAMENSRADIEKVIYESQKNSQASLNFVKQNNLKTQETAYLSQKDQDGSKLKNKLAERLFISRKKLDAYGTFVFEDDRVLYQISDIQKSYIPNFVDIKDKVLDEYYKEKAIISLKTEVKRVKRELLNNKIDFDKLAANLNLKLVETKEVKKNDKVKSVNVGENFTKKAFTLIDSKQILTYKNDQDYFLVKLLKIDISDSSLFDLEKNNIIEKEKFSGQNAYLQGFIATLLRSARIEKSEEFLNISQK